jgi:hypothetical protein
MKIISFFVRKIITFLIRQTGKINNRFIRNLVNEAYGIYFWLRLIFFRVGIIKIKLLNYKRDKPKSSPRPTAYEERKAEARRQLENDEITQEEYNRIARGRGEEKGAPVDSGAVYEKQAKEAGAAGSQALSEEAINYFTERQKEAISAAKRQRNPVVLYLPAASVERHFIRETRAAFSGLAKVITIKVESHPSNKVRAAVARVNLLFIPGGNTYLLA